MKVEVMSPATNQAKKTTFWSRLRARKDSGMEAWADRIGIFLSGLCLLHCLATPIMFLALPNLSIFELHHDLHAILVIVLPVFALVAFVPGFRRHRQLTVWGWAIAGIVAIVIATSLFEATWGENILTVAGSIFLIRAHLLNREYCACCAVGRSPVGKPARVPFLGRNRQIKLEVQELRSVDESPPSKRLLP